MCPCYSWAQLHREPRSFFAACHYQLAAVNVPSNFEATDLCRSDDHKTRIFSWKIIIQINYNIHLDTHELLLTELGIHNQPSSKHLAPC